MSQIEPNTSGRTPEPTVIAHTVQVALGALGVGQWAILDNPTLNVVLTVVWLVVGGLVARKNRAEVKPVR